MIPSLLNRMRRSDQQDQRQSAWQRAYRPGVVVVALSSLMLSACAGMNASNTSSLIEGGAPASGGDVQKTRFNPFAELDDVSAGRRQIIENPTLAQVRQPGPLDEITLGSSNAPVTVIKYFSPTCPFCRQWQNSVYPDFKRTYVDTGKVRLVMREFPIGHQSGAATVAIRCAAPNRRLALYKAFLDKQSQWVSQEVRRDPIFRIAKDYGLTRQEFDACYEDKALIAGLKAVKDRGRTLGIIGTPNFFINNKLEKRVLRMDDLKALIDPLLAGGDVEASATGRTAG